MPQIVVVARFDHERQHVASLGRANCWTVNGALNCDPLRSADALTVRREMDSVHGRAYPDLVTIRDRNAGENRWGFEVGSDFKLDASHGISAKRRNSPTVRDDVDNCHSILASGGRCR